MAEQIMGVLRWYVEPAEQWAVQQAIFDRLQTLGLQSKPWSSRTAVIWFGSSENDATEAFQSLRRWLGDYKATATAEGKKFFFVLSASMRGAFGLQ